MSEFKVWRPEGGRPIKAWIKGVEFETQAAEQLDRLAKLPFIGPHIAVMPDAHAGKGSTIGSVIPTDGAVIPAAAGVDLGCGMRFALTDLTVADLNPGRFPAIRAAIEAKVPNGRSDNGGPRDRGAWERPPVIVLDEWSGLGLRYQQLVDRVPGLEHKMALQQLGTLGTGNHFIEICADEQGRVWIVVHSGSRGVGARIGTHFMKAARNLMKKWFIRLEDPDLAYLPEDTTEFKDYIQAVLWAQEYAYCSRRIMLENTLWGLRIGGSVIVRVTASYDCHHNYIARENHFGRNYWVTRKGAVRARAGEIAIIPGSMGARSYIVEGLGNEGSFHSCSHGAGRRMSRAEALRTFTVEDHVQATAGVECRKDESVLDETPGSYKDIDRVIEAEKDLVRVVHTLKQFIVVKGPSEDEE